MKLYLILFCLICSSAINMAKPLIYLVKNQTLPAYEEAIEAITSELISTYDIEEVIINRKNVVSVTSMLKKSRPKLIISVGTKATKLLQTKLKRQPILFTMVFRPHRTELVKSLKFPGKNATGVALDIPLELQFETLRKVFPYWKRIGTLYTPYLDQDLIDEATKIAETHGFTLLSREVYSKDQIQKQLETLFREQIQLLWSTADQKIYSKKSLQYILLSLNRFKVPYMGLSNSYLKLGAYFSMDPDPTAIGTKTAHMAHRMITKRQMPMITPVEFPDKVNYSINEKVMTQFGFKMTPDILEGADLLYK